MKSSLVFLQLEKQIDHITNHILKFSFLTLARFLSRCDRGIMETGFPTRSTCSSRRCLITKRRAAELLSWKGGAWGTQEVEAAFEDLPLCMLRSTKYRGSSTAHLKMANRNGISLRSSSIGWNRGSVELAMGSCLMDWTFWSDGPYIRKANLKWRIHDG